MLCYVMLYVQELYVEERGERSLLGSFEECVPGMYLLGMEQLIDVMLCHVICSGVVR